MKTGIVKNLLSSILLIALLFTGNSCKNMFDDPLKDKTTGNDITVLLLDLNFFETKFKIHILDAETQEYITGTDLSIVVLGKDSANICDYSGEKKAEYTTSTGFFELTCDPNVEISEANPLEFEIGVSSESYFAFPTSVYITTKGTEDVYVYALKISSNKSAALSQGNEPFKMTYTPASGLLLISDNVEIINRMTSNYLSGQFEIKSLYRNVSSGTLKASDFTGDQNLYSDYGFLFLTSPSFDPRNTSQLLKERTFGSNICYIASALERKAVEKCKNGMQVTYTKSSGVVGSAAFDYVLTFSNGTTKSGSHTGSFNGNSNSFSRNINNYYYPTNNTSGTLTIKGDAQYDVSPSSFSLDNVCNRNQLAVTVTPKSVLTHYKFTYIITCKDGGMIGGALTYNIQFRKQGSTEPWNWATAQQGVLDLYIERGAIYDFKLSFNGEPTTFSIPTDPDMEIEQSLRSLANENVRFVPTSDNEFGLKVTDNGSEVIINANVELSGTYCSMKL
jgi:hypothetical protein